MVVDYAAEQIYDVLPSATLERLDNFILKYQGHVLAAQGVLKLDTLQRIIRPRPKKWAIC